MGSKNFQERGKAITGRMRQNYELFHKVCQVLNRGMVDAHL